MYVAFVKSCLRAAIRVMPGPLRRFLLAEMRAERTATVAVQNEVDKLIIRASRAANENDFDLSEALLVEAATLEPTSQEIAPHMGRLDLLRSRSLDPAVKAEAEMMSRTLLKMREELERGEPIYVPSEFWGTYGRFHLQLLEKYGIENFKRTVSHHYQNWCMTSMYDPQVQQLHRTWAKHHSLQPWKNVIEAPDHVGLHTSLSFDVPTYPLAYPEKREVYRVSVGLLYEFVSANDPLGILESVPELEVGNPVRIWRKGKMISSDNAHSVRERNLLLTTLSLEGDEALTVGEIGAGYGRLAEVFGRTTNYRYYIFDVTPALYISQWYIKAIFPNERIFEFRHFDSFADIKDELSQCRFAFFTANQIASIPEKHLNLLLNMNSLMEMRIDQIDNFLGQIDRVTSNAFLSRQWLNWQNPLDKHAVGKDNFRMNSRWKLELDTIDDIYPDFFNQIWVRKPCD